jgi:hypothetical protein
VRVGLAAPSDVPLCDICENAPAFFYCEVDGTSLCLQCDMIVHVGGKRTHKRYLLLRQRVEFPGDKLVGKEDATTTPMDVGVNKQNGNQSRQCSGGDNQQNQKVPSIPASVGIADGHVKKDAKMIDLNMKPHRLHGQASNYQEL